MIKHSGRPIHNIVALRAIRRKTRGDMIRVRRVDKIGLMTRDAIDRRSREGFRVARGAI